MRRTPLQQLRAAQGALSERLETSWPRAREALAARLTPVTQKHAFCVVSATHNAQRWVERHLDSVHGQRYPRERVLHVIVDDASTDGTGQRVRRWLRNHPESRVEYWRNDSRLGGAVNLTREFRRASHESIVLQVDGDDWLPDSRVLDFLNRVYQDPDVWMTYNSWRFPDGRPAVNSEPIPQAVTEAGDYRGYRWISSHLHSFRRPLFDFVKDETLIDPDTGEYYGSAVDMSHYFPMLELAGKHARHLHRITYVYNMHEASLVNASRARQLVCEAKIRALPHYEPLSALPAKD